MLARFLLQASRLPARLDPDTGEAVALPYQDRSRWDRRLIAEGFGHLEAAAPGDIVAAYRVEAEIATPFAQLHPSAAVRLNHAIAMGYRDGPAAGLAALESDTYLVAAARAEFYHQAGDREAAAVQFGLAAAQARTEPERRNLTRRGG